MIKVGKILKFLGSFKQYDLHVGFVKPGTKIARVLPAEEIQIDKTHKAVVILCMPEAPPKPETAGQPSRLILPPGYDRNSARIVPGVPSSDVVGVKR
jgi:hypothetical protein